MGSANLENPIHTSQLGSDQNRWGKMLLGRCNHDNFFDTSNLGWDNIHEDGGRIGCGATRYIGANPLNWPNQLTTDNTLTGTVLKTRLQLLAVVGFDINLGIFQGGQDLWINLLKGLVNQLLPNLKVCHLNLVKELGIVSQSLVTVSFDRFNDLSHRFFHI